MNSLIRHPLALLLALATSTLADPPKGWAVLGLAANQNQRTKEYDASLDRTTFRSGKASATLRCVTEEPTVVGSMAQAALPGDYAGKRVRMTVWIKTKEVSEYSAMYFTVYGENTEFRLAWDTMQKRRLKGTTDWTKCELVLDVAKEAQMLVYGLQLAGTGQAWVDDVLFEVVGQDVAVTDEREKPKPLGLPLPTNLDFEE